MAATKTVKWSTLISAQKQITARLCATSLSARTKIESQRIIIHVFTWAGKLGLPATSQMGVIRTETRNLKERNHELHELRKSSRIVRDPSYNSCNSCNSYNSWLPLRPSVDPIPTYCRTGPEVEISTRATVTLETGGCGVYSSPSCLVHFGEFCARS